MLMHVTPSMREISCEFFKEEDWEGLARGDERALKEAGGCEGGASRGPGTRKGPPGPARRARPWPSRPAEAWQPPAARGQPFDIAGESSRLSSGRDL